MTAYPRLATLALTAWISAVPLVAQAGSADPTRSSETPMTDEVRAVAPALAHYAEAVLFGEVWKRTDLTARDRSIVTLAALIATNQAAALPPYVERALDDGVKPVEVAEVITHLAFYAGWPSAVSASAATRTVFERRGVAVADLSAGNAAPITSDPASERERIAYVDRSFGDVAPGLRDFTNGVLFGDLWRRPQLTPRDRSLVTISALIAGGNDAQLVGHLNRGMDNGLTKAEVGAVLTQLAFYAGWPRAASAAAAVKAVLEKRP